MPRNDQGCFLAQKPERYSEAEPTDREFAPTPRTLRSMTGWQRVASTERPFDIRGRCGGGRGDRCARADASSVHALCTNTRGAPHWAPPKPYICRWQTLRQQMIGSLLVAQFPSANVRSPGIEGAATRRSIWRQGCIGGCARLREASSNRLVLIRHATPASTSRRNCAVANGLAGPNQRRLRRRSGGFPLSQAIRRPGAETGRNAEQWSRPFGPPQ